MTKKYLPSFALVEEFTRSGSGPHFLHEINGAWQKVAAPILQGSTITSIAMVSANEGWGVGTAGEILHYLNGNWIAYPTQ